MTDQPDLKARLWNAAHTYAAEKGGFLPGDTIFAEAASRITELEAERDEARTELAAHDRAMANERRRWREHPMMQRLDAVRQSIAGLRPGDAEWLATAQSEFLDVEARAQAAQSRLALAEKVVEAAKKLAIEWISYDAGIYGDMKHQAAINDCGEALSAALAAYEGGGGASKLQGNQDDA